ncbi:MAG: hypothetical protein K8T89_22605, partial [Planctomycetes bacterium]|nr:hypothetical protein [Planctomycetota bacterium]
LGKKAMLKIIKHQGTPDQSVEIVTLDLDKQTTHTFPYEGGRRKSLASVPLPGIPMDFNRKPNREKEVMAKLRSITNGTGVPAGIEGGTGTATAPSGFAGRDQGDASLVDVTQNASYAASTPGGFEISHQAILSKDGRKIQLKMAPVFQTAGNLQQAKIKLDFIPGAD